MVIDQTPRYGEALVRAYLAKALRTDARGAFVCVIHDHEGENGPGLGFAIERERGYYPVPKFYYAAETYEAASIRADELNASLLNLTREQATEIIASTMGGGW